MWQMPVGPSALGQATALLRTFSGAGFRAHECGGCLSLMWHDQALFTSSVWRAAPPTNTATGDGVLDKQADNGKSSSGSSGHHQAAAAPGGIAMK
jgi:hypothetical protein